MTVSITRKQFLMGASAAAGAMVSAPFVARAARPTVIKLGHDQTPANPITKYVNAAADQIKKETNGEVVVQVFPNSELGTDVNTVSSVRSGALQMMGMPDNILADLSPSAGISNLGYAFKDAKVLYAAMDGEVGDVVRADLVKRGLQPLPVIWTLGFRQITASTKPIKTPQDLKGFKLRVPDSAVFVTLFRGLGAAPTTIDISEAYTALQTHVVDGEGNALSTIETQKFYQVQKYCSLTSHMWTGYWMVLNGPFWKRLPADHQKVITNVFQDQGLKERVAMEAFNDGLQPKLTAQGLTFNTPDRAPFRAELVKSGYYDHWQKKYGEKLWSLVEKYTGTLA